MSLFTRERPMTESRHERMSSLRLVGTSGFFSEEEISVERGMTVTVGRSRRCTVSLQRTAAYRNGDRGSLARDPNFRKVSRTHFKISFLHPYLVEVENLSGNGTYVDGKRIDRVLLSDFRSRSYRITFGGNEGFRLEWEGLNGAS